MAKFFFDLRHQGGDLDIDDLGLHLAEAHRAAIDLWAEARREGTKPTYYCFEIRDASARIASLRLWVSVQTTDQSRCR